MMNEIDKIIETKMSEIKNSIREVMHTQEKIKTDTKENGLETCENMKLKKFHSRYLKKNGILYHDFLNQLNKDEYVYFKNFVAYPTEKAIKEGILEKELKEYQIGYHLRSIENSPLITKKGIKIYEHFNYKCLSHDIKESALLNLKEFWKQKIRYKISYRKFLKKLKDVGLLKKDGSMYIPTKMSVDLCIFERVIIQKNIGYYNKIPNITKTGESFIINYIKVNDILEEK